MKYFKTVKDLFHKVLLILLLITASDLLLAQSLYSNIDFHPVPLSNISSSAYPVAQQPSAETGLHWSNHLVNTYKDNIRLIERDHGPFNILVRQQTESLGDLLVKNGDYEEAIQAYEKIMHIMRVNHGLYNEEQETLLDKIINTNMQVKNYSRAHDLQKSKLYLKQKNYYTDDSRYIKALLDWADWNVQLLLNSDHPHQAEVERPGATIDTFLLTAQENYIKAIDLIQASDEVNHVRLIHAEKKLAAINYIANSITKLSKPMYLVDIDDNTNSFNSSKGRRENRAEMAYFLNGSSALKRAIANSLESPEPNFISIAEQMMALGDWYLLFDRRSSALQMYEDSFDFLNAIGASADDIEKVMTPGMPVNKSSLANTDNTKRVFSGYIDVEFKVSKFGIAYRPEVIATSEEEISPVIRTLIRKIRNEKFRPAFIDGSATSNENVKLRYYYSYN